MEELKENLESVLGKSKLKKKLDEVKMILPPFHKSRNDLPKSTVTWSIDNFLQLTTRNPMSIKGLCRVSPAMGHEMTMLLQQVAARRK